MFGRPAAFVGGRMFASLHRESMVVRLAPTELAAFLALPGAGPFEPMPGRPMTRYAVVPGLILMDEPLLPDWLGRALAFTRGLPPRSDGSPSGVAR